MKVIAFYIPEIFKIYVENLLIFTYDLNQYICRYICMQQASKKYSFSGELHENMRSILIRVS